MTRARTLVCRADLIVRWSLKAERQDYATAFKRFASRYAKASASEELIFMVMATGLDKDSLMKLLYFVDYLYVKAGIDDKAKYGTLQKIQQKMLVLWSSFFSKVLPHMTLWKELLLNMRGIGSPLSLISRLRKAVLLQAKQLWKKWKLM